MVLIFLFSSLKFNELKRLREKMQLFIKRKQQELVEVKRRYKIKLELKEKYLNKLGFDIEEINKVLNSEIKKAQDALQNDKIKCK
jgi:hypothetical protein